MHFDELAATQIIGGTIRAKQKMDGKETGSPKVSFEIESTIDRTVFT